jgi:hypothetical protein
MSLQPAIIGLAGYRYWIVDQRRTEIDSRQSAGRCLPDQSECVSLHGGGPRSRCFGGVRGTGERTDATAEQRADNNADQTAREAD